MVQDAGADDTRCQRRPGVHDHLEPICGPAYQRSATATVLGWLSPLIWAGIFAFLGGGFYLILLYRRSASH